MFVLTCPSCRQQLRVKFARHGATATCPSCKALFKVDAMTLRSESHDGPQEPPRRPGAADRLSVLRSAIEQVDLPQQVAVAVAGEKVRPRAPARFAKQEDVQSPLAVVIVAAFALTAAVVVWLMTGGTEPSLADERDPHPLPVPLASATEAARVQDQASADLLRTEPADEDPPELADRLGSRVQLIEQPSGGGEAPVVGAVALESVESKISAGAADGSPTLLLAMRNMAGHAVRNPRFVLELLDGSGAVLRSWRGAVDATLAPGQTLELQAEAPPDMADPPGRLVLRAYGLPMAAKP